jgi:hypothetical protein
MIVAKLATTASELLSPDFRPMLCESEVRFLKAARYAV